jgi:hypothetical protein
MGYLDSLTLLHAHYQERTHEMKWQAALAGKKLK